MIYFLLGLSAMFDIWAICATVNAAKRIKELEEKIKFLRDSLNEANNDAC